MLIESAFDCVEEKLVLEWLLQQCHDPCLSRPGSCRRVAAPGNEDRGNVDPVDGEIVQEAQAARRLMQIEYQASTVFGIVCRTERLA